MKTTYNDIDKSIESYKGSRIVFAIVVALCLLLPSLGMIWAKSDVILENRELVSWPELFDETDGLNVGYLSAIGDYFNDHFAYRAQLIDAGAHLYAQTFGVSTADTVIYGNSDWLYYAGTLSDWQDKSPLRERQCLNIAHNIALIQEECEANGAQFVFTIAPDKNSLYGQDMPYYYPHIASNDMDLLKAQLEGQGVNYLDARSLFTTSDERLYFLRDSHWTDKGALIVQNALAGAAGFETLGITPEELLKIDNYTGDLAKMLYPLSAGTEPNWYAEGINDGSGTINGSGDSSASHTSDQSGEHDRSGYYWEFTRGSSVEESTVQTKLSDLGNTELGDTNGSLIMFNDSFGHNLIPYLASEFQTASFSKRIPYNVLTIAEESPSTVIVERSQRHIDYLAEEAPLMFSHEIDEPSLLNETPRTIELENELTLTTNGPLLGISGYLSDESHDPNTNIVVQLKDTEGNTAYFSPFYLSNTETENDFGFCVYVDIDTWANTLSTVNVILTTQDSSEYSLYSTPIESEQRTALLQSLIKELP